ncbi:rod shape-determining protein MreD [Extensimonas vulgaris]|uniref:Rod shape-determining protein MreD n=1 Tax=Extensimonas vulgaris TaxID=1031594 RepID=A0A369APK5_9BURK|nr:rod shape-determining protein MreD [Extensimonas vulgaris]RCX10983.1 rod shape-determining protein MreD [Extensimonas vulgaris]TWI41657.1 rod shape-determining protein MreD [Extensimonas vulgaris]TXD16127.1 rod shape-determining protein MreD [Extensimonas vulgaris]
MIMPPGQPLLLPAKPFFIAASLVAGLALNMLPLGREVWMPDFLMLLLAFWCVHQPQRVGMGVAFVLGLCMDVHATSLLGQHALAYAVLAYGAAALQRRLAWFSAWAQALHVLPLLLLAHAIELALGLAGGGAFPGVAVVVAPLLETLLWPLASWVLLAPQRRPPESDENRPL